jgi:hypothetical protein
MKTCQLENTKTLATTPLHHLNAFGLSFHTL